MTASPTRYPAAIVRVIDGDTVLARISLGMNVQITQRVRLAGIDAPENHTLAGRLATAYTQQRLLHQTVELEIGSRVFDKYGRVLATVWHDGENFNDQLMQNGHAVPYPPE